MLAQPVGGEGNALHQQATTMLLDPVASRAVMNQRFGQTDATIPMQLSGLDTDGRVANVIRNPTTEGIESVWNVGRREAVDLALLNAPIRSQAERSDNRSLTNELRVQQGMFV